MSLTSAQRAHALANAKVSGGTRSGVSYNNSTYQRSSSGAVSGTPTGSLGTSLLGGYSDSGVSGYLSAIQGLTQANNAWSAQQADRQMQFQQGSADKAMQFEHDEAELNRNWQEYMSNTAHQREVKDLQAAGLNPVLSATGGQGAPVTSGATASGYSSQGAKGDTDSSGASALATLLGSLLQSQTALLSQSMAAQNSLAVADKYTAATRFASTTAATSAQSVADKNYKQATDVAMINRGTQVQVASINASSNITAHQISSMGYQAAAAISGQYHLSASRENALASIINTNTTALAKKYGDDLNAATQKEIASASRDLQRDLQQAGFDFSLEYQLNEHTHQLELQKKGFFFNAGKDFIDENAPLLSTLLGDLFSGHSGGAASGYPPIMSLPRLGS